eukprot:TRINITY_DN7715_c0_g1_i1.p1 TRINITY_DN7715_c0_g1~~TRINITY_DN7715_c0_g1_i1.p1  ORF type:complete len:102 (+),score=10.01 TRINITY_DN7715_c0_g1_i1:22-306(+)
MSSPRALHDVISPGPHSHIATPEEVMQASTQTMWSDLHRINHNHAHDEDDEDADYINPRFIRPSSVKKRGVPERNEIEDILPYVLPRKYFSDLL